MTVSGEAGAVGIAANTGYFTATSVYDSSVVPKR